MLYLALFKEGRFSVDFSTWPPEILFPSESMLWRLLVFAGGVWMIVNGIRYNSGNVERQQFDPKTESSKSSMDDEIE